MDFGEKTVSVIIPCFNEEDNLSELANRLNTSLHKEGFDVVYARRTRRDGESWFKKSTAKLFYRILERFTTFEIPLDAGDFRLIDRKVVEMLKQMPEQNKFLRGQIAWMGFRQTYVEFERDTRRHGQTGYPFKKMLDFALDGITSLSNRPLRLVTQAGFFVSFFSFLILLYALGSHFILERTITGWTSIIISIAFLGGVQLLSIGIIGEYLSRINKNVLNRPLYVVEESDIEPGPEKATKPRNRPFKGSLKRIPRYRYKCSISLSFSSLSLFCSPYAHLPG